MYCAFCGGKLEATGANYETSAAPQTQAVVPPKTTVPSKTEPLQSTPVPSSPPKKGMPSLVYAGIVILVALLLVAVILRVSSPGTVSYNTTGQTTGSSQASSDQSTASSSSGPTTFTVQANQGWQDTGIAVTAGQTIQVNYVSGLWTDHAGYYAPFDANGQPDSYTCAAVMDPSQCGEAVPFAVKGSLVGMIGQEVLAIGSGGSFSATESGDLLLRMNDGNGQALDDNQGAITVSVSVS